MPTASCGRNGKGVTLAPILNKGKQRGQDNTYKVTQQKGFYDKVKPPRQGRLNHHIYSSQGCCLQSVSEGTSKYALAYAHNRVRARARTCTRAHASWLHGQAGAAFRGNHGPQCAVMGAPP